MVVGSKKRPNEVDINSSRKKISRVDNEGKLRKMLKKRMSEDAFSDSEGEGDLSCKEHDYSEDDLSEQEDSLSDEELSVDRDEYSDPDSDKDPDDFADLVENKAEAEPVVKLTRKQRVKLRVKQEKQARRELKSKKAVKEEKPLPLTSSVSLLAKHNEISENPSKLLQEIKTRIKQRNDLSLQIKPVPSNCAPEMITDICPSSLHFYHPRYKGANYGFVIFRSITDLERGRKELSGKLIKNKPLVICPCSIFNEKLKDKKLEDYDLNKLVVMNLTRSTNRFDLGQIFRKAVDVKFRELSDKSCAGSCDVLFKSSEDAMKSFYNCHQAKVRGIPIYINFAPKSKPLAEEGVEKLDNVNISSTKPSLMCKDPVATSSEEETNLDTDRQEFTIKNRTAQTKKKGGLKLHAYQQRPKNTGPKTKMKKHKPKKH